MSELYRVIGLMSGTSLDGLDIAYCEFLKEDKWSFKFINTSTVKYNDAWKGRLTFLHTANAFEYVKTDIEFGKFLGEACRDFIVQHNCKPDFIASHGHTVFHQPSLGITSQIGNGAAITAQTSLPVICDFRIKDVCLGGQGAPLVPIGDQFLFADYNYCLNLGGIANISFTENNRVLAYDICPLNQALNYFANSLGHEYDSAGAIASMGDVNQELLSKLSNLAFYKQPAPKSLGREWVDKEFLTLVNEYTLPAEDNLRTICEHAAIEIGKCISADSSKKVLLTGGGVYNDFLINLIKSKTKAEMLIPSDTLIQFKEALIFAFLGVLRVRNEVNCLNSVTGASFDNCGGAIY